MEVHTSFAHLYARILDRLHRPPGEVLFTLTLRGGVWDRTRLFLTEYYKVPIWQVGDPTKYVVYGDPATTKLTVLPAQLRQQLNHVAYQLVAAFADLFEMPHEKIPFVSDINGVKEIDIDQIIKL